MLTDGGESGPTNGVKKRQEKNGMEAGGKKSITGCFFQVRFTITLFTTGTPPRAVAQRLY